MKLHFIGSEMMIGDVKLTDFGEEVELDESTARDIISRNAPLLPAKDFRACGFTAAELKAFKYPGQRHQETPEFAAKHLKARLRLAELREQFAGAPVIEKQEATTNGNG